MTMTCPECLRDFPPVLIQPLVTEVGSRPMCPICALRERNARAGLPLDTPFKGPLARLAYQRALDHLREKEES